MNAPGEVIAEGLNAEDVRRYVAASAGMVPPESLTTAIHDQTEGNPLFVREVVQFLAQNGQLNGGGATIRKSLHGTRR